MDTDEDFEDIKCKVDESSTESDTEQFFCYQCPSQFQVKKELEKDKKIKHSVKKYICTVCGFQLN